MIVEDELFTKILKDPKWIQFLLHKEDGSIWIDLKKYSDNKCYLPIGNDIGSYVDGYLFTEKLYNDKYRTKDSLVELEFPKYEYQPIRKLVRRPIFHPIEVAKRYDPNDIIMERRVPYIEEYETTYKKVRIN